MIEYQKKFPEFPEHPWTELEDNTWQLISLRDIYKFRFRFHGHLVEKRRYLNAYMEKEIIYARLRGIPIRDELINGEYKK